MQGIVVPTVLELLANPPAHLEPTFRRHGHVAPVEECMQVAPEEQPVPRLVRAVGRKGFDVRRLEHRKSPFAGHRATPLVEVGDEYSEGALAKPRINDGWAPESLRYSLRLVW